AACRAGGPASGAAFAVGGVARAARAREPPRGRSLERAAVAASRVHGAAADATFPGLGGGERRETHAAGLRGPVLDRRRGHARQSRRDETSRTPQPMTS